MSSKPLLAALAATALSALIFVEACASGPAVHHAVADAAPDRVAHAQAVMKSSYCAACHPDLYAEHEQNTHGRAFTDEEVRLGTGRFSQGDCIVCHTPRPIFESGIGMNPIRRHHDLEAGITCMTCHWKSGVDYGGFQGGADCKAAFDPRVGQVEACASCHRNHGTPYQWELAKNGKQAGHECVDCHMPIVERPVAVGEKPRAVRSHVFPGARSVTQVARAYRYEAKVEENEVVVSITNAGAGHNFPTELKQRSLESVVVVRDGEGKEVARSRMVFRDPYKRPYGLTLQVNTQIPSGETRTHRVPIAVADGSVTCELHYKYYFPIEDYHPELARLLEMRELPFHGLVPSTQPVESAPEVRIVTPDGIAPETAGVANLVDYARPKISKVEVDVPQGDSQADIDALVQLFQFPVLQANLEARKRLSQIGAKAVPALVVALGSWDNKTWNQSMAVLENIGEPAGPAVADAMAHPELYVRLHAYELLGRMGWKADRTKVLAHLKAALARPNALDRSVAALAVGALHLEELEHDLEHLLGDADPDVTRGAARALAHLGVKSAAPAVAAALKRAMWDETRRDLAEALARLGDPSGVSVLLAGLDHRDDLVRESFFEALFNVTGRHFGYEPLAPREERQVAIARLQGWWAKEGGVSALRPAASVPWKVNSEARKLVDAIGGSDGSAAPVDDDVARARLIELGEKAVPALTLLGLKYPAGFDVKRAKLCGILAEIHHPDAVPALIATLRDPVVYVSAWACAALERIGDREAVPALRRYQNRLMSLMAHGRFPASAGTPDDLVAQALKARLKLGDETAQPELVSLLLSPDPAAV
ncbi:MAG: HEAT repeat domain-containing protein, partial [Planctomycetes bacterium]|nr:HEAT repeat domain-containing protein [Planctomycetota bacterium]